MISVNLGSLDDDWGDFKFDPQSDKQDEAKAAWIHDGTISLVGDKYSATITGQGTAEDRVRTVPCFDFSRWVWEHRNKDMIVKMDIEGAEVPILLDMMFKGTLDIPKMFFIEWHDWLYPEWWWLFYFLRKKVRHESISPYSHSDSDALVESWIASQKEYRQDAGISG